MRFTYLTLQRNNINYVNYLFFDIECANCDNGVGKICSFGYVLCDESFNLIEKQDLLINPNAKFSYGVMNKKFITLGYPKSEFLCQPKFNERYPFIKEILTRPDQLVIGHAVDNDVNFILGDCDRYRLPVFEYDFFDSQELYRLYAQNACHKNLTAICEELSLPVGTAHRSDDDAEMTMRITKCLCEREKLSLTELLDKYPPCKHKMRDVIARHNERKKYHLFKLFISRCRQEKNIVNEKFYRKSFCFSRKVENIDYGKTAALIQLIKDCGGEYVTDVTKADFFVRSKGGCDRLNKAVSSQSTQVITLNTLARALGISYGKLPAIDLSKRLAGLL